MKGYKKHLIITDTSFLLIHSVIYNQNFKKCHVSETVFVSILRPEDEAFSTVAMDTDSLR
jgi:hypothetical protein